MKEIKVYYAPNTTASIGNIFSEFNPKQELFEDEFTEYGFTIFNYYHRHYDYRINFISSRSLYINTDLIDVEKIKNNNLMSEEELHNLMFNLIDALHTNNEYEVDIRVLKAIQVLSKGLRKDK